MFKQHYIVVDDLYHDPMAVRNLALSLPRGDVLSGNYAGCMSEVPWITDTHLDTFEQLTNESLEYAAGLCGFFRFTCANDTWTQHIHFDPRAGQVWAGVVYLSLPDDIQRHEKSIKTGTTFWHHNRTGLNAIPLDEQSLQQHGWHDEMDLKRFLETDGMDESLWTETFYVPAKFNRLVLFRPWLFHSPGRAFGDTAENCRLVHLFFLSVKGTKEMLAKQKS